MSKQQASDPVLMVFQQEVLIDLLNISYKCIS